METGNATIDRANGHYTIITADSHAGGSHAAYREYLDPKYREDFDAWRAKYSNPFKDLGDTRRFRNWDNEMRNGQQEEDGVVGEVIFPNTVPPFFPGFVLFAPPPKPEDYEHRPGRHPGPQPLAGRLLPASSRTAGPASARSSSTTSTTPSTTSGGSRSTACGAACSSPTSRPTSSGSSRSTTRPTTGCGQVIQDLEMPVNVHGGTGAPDYGKLPVLHAPLHQRGRVLLPAPAWCTSSSAASSSASPASSSS